MNVIAADFIIVGGGLYGCATAYHLAQKGAKEVVLLERASICTGGTAKSCAIVRTHYSIQANLVHAVESLKVFSDFDNQVGGDNGWQRTGYIIIGPEDHRQAMEQVFSTQNQFGIDTAVLTPAEAKELHPLLQIEDVGVIGYDSMTGYADPYLTTMAYAQRARDLGVVIHDQTPVTGLSRNGKNTIVTTADGDYESPNVILALGPWTHDLTRPLGINLPYVVSRHKVVTLRIDRPYSLEWPIVKDLTTSDKIYFRPETGGVVLVGTGDHGDPIGDADTLTDHVDMVHVARIDKLISHRMPAFAEAELTAGWTGPYDISHDWNPIVGPLPGYDGISVMVGFSGHGFKLAPTIAEAMAETLLGQEVRVPIDVYSPDRFEQGEVLTGAYGIGSIS